MTGMKTDLYQLTMAQGYFLNNKHEQYANFNLFFRKCPFNGNYAIASGLREVINYLENFGYSKKEIDYLSNITGADGQPLFEERFLKYLKKIIITRFIQDEFDRTGIGVSHILHELHRRLRQAAPDGVVDGQGG